MNEVLRKHIGEVRAALAEAGARCLEAEKVVGHARINGRGVGPALAEMRAARKAQLQLERELASLQNAAALDERRAA